MYNPNKIKTKMNIIQKIQKLVMSAESFDFASYVLKDGTMIECDTEELEVGSIISIVKDGSKELAPAGEHTLEDGRTIVLDDAAKVTEIKESDAPTAEEVEAKEEKMAMEVDLELVQAVSDMLKAKVTTLADEDASSLANEIVYAITAYDEAKDLVEGDEDSVENGIVTNTTTAGYSEERFNALTEVVLEMAKKNEELEVKLSKVPTGKAISEMEFKSDDSAADSMLEARIAAIKNLNK
jgi:hypothetical protein